MKELDYMLLECIENDEIDKAKELIQAGADVHAVDSYGRNALMVAAGHGYLDIVKLLLEKGANVNTLINGRSPLKSAAYCGHFDVVKLLIEHGAIILSASHDNWSALLSSYVNDHFDIAKLLLEHGADINDLFLIDEPMIISNLKYIRNEFEQRTHMLTPENVKKWKRMRLSSLYK